MPARYLETFVIGVVCCFAPVLARAEAVSVPLKKPKQGKAAPYGPAQATGEPEILTAGDNPQAWTPQQPDGGIEWLLVEFENVVRIAEIRIRESNNPGAVIKVVALFDDKETVVFEGEDPSEAAPTDLIIEPVNDVRTKSVKIFIDTKIKPGWEQIDAVELVGKDGSS